MKGGDKGGRLYREICQLTAPVHPRSTPSMTRVGHPLVHIPMICELGKDSTELLIQAVQRCVTGSTD